MEWPQEDGTMTIPSGHPGKCPQLSSHSHSLTPLHSAHTLCLTCLAVRLLPVPWPVSDFKKKLFKLAFLYQPLDEIRDYFGEETALYFAWLGTYTRALLGLSMFGVISMLTQFTVSPEHNTPAGAERRESS